MAIVTRQEKSTMDLALAMECVESAMRRNGKGRKLMNDLISRSALIKRRRKVVEYDEAGFSVDYFAVSVEEINNAPTVEAKPVVHGKWIYNGFSEAWICSECRDGYKDQPTIMGSPLFDYCPICGADMRKQPVGKTDKLEVQE